MSHTKEFFRKLSKNLLKRIKANDPEACAKFEKASGIAPQYACLMKCQHVIAKEFGFKNWAQIPNDDVNGNK